jgi:PTS system mannose-specific IIB component
MAANMVLVRIDDRLIHGQVAIGWVKAISPEWIVVANDNVAEDAIQRTLMEMAAPPNLGVTLCHVSEVAEICASPEMSGKRILLLFSSTQDALTAVESGLPVKEIDVGGLRYSPGKRQIMKAVAVDDKDLEDFQALMHHGIHVVIQMVPTDEPVDMRKYIK